MGKVYLLIKQTMNTLVVLCAIVAVTCAGVVQQKAAATEKRNDWDGWTRPSFCRGLDCPVYDLVESQEGFELRSYKSGVWVSTQTESIDYTDSQNGEMFQKLFRYISGANVRDETIEMTAPVINRIIPGSGPNCKSTFRMSFYMEWSKQGSAPEPTESGVFLETLPPMSVYVGHFSGYASMDDYITNVMTLGAAIGDESKFNTGYWFAAGYDSPFQPFFRRNEVWLVARD